jgi:FSR family fosmidomycin resistance protein-like MFS transporter
MSTTPSSVPSVGGASVNLPANVPASTPAGPQASAVAKVHDRTSYGVLTAISFCHFLNDMIQSLLPAIYPLLKSSYQLDFSQVGLITFTNQMVASVLQPVVGSFTDKRPQSYSLVFGMGCSLGGLLLLAWASNFPLILLAAALVGLGSSVFHPESSRVARMASGGQHGFAQSFFQVGGNAGSATGPLLAAFIVLPHGQESIAWFSLAALLAMAIMGKIGGWAKRYRAALKALHPKGAPLHQAHALSSKQVNVTVGILVVLIFSKYIYMASLTSYYTFYLIQKFGISVQSSQVYLFVFLGAVAAGTILGGPIGDRVGRKYVIWCSILGVLPFTLILPYVNLFWTGVFSALIGMTLASAFPAIVVYAQELLPGKVGMISGLFFGLAFGVAGIGAAMLGRLADYAGIDFVYKACAFLPLLGLATMFLPDIEGTRGGTPKKA